MRVLSISLAQAVVHELAVSGSLLKGQLVERTGASAPAVTKRLAQLEEVGVVVADQPVGQRHGKRIRYSLDRGVARAGAAALVRYLVPDSPSLGDTD